MDGCVYKWMTGWTCTMIALDLYYDYIYINKKNDDLS